MPELPQGQDPEDGVASADLQSVSDPTDGMNDMDRSVGAQCKLWNRSVYPVRCFHSSDSDLALLMVGQIT